MRPGVLIHILIVFGVILSSWCIISDAMALPHSERKERVVLILIRRPKDHEEQDKRYVLIKRKPAELIHVYLKR